MRAVLHIAKAGFPATLPLSQLQRRSEAAPGAVALNGWLVNLWRGVRSRRMRAVFALLLEGTCHVAL
jgi:hypothetical protein